MKLTFSRITFWSAFIIIIAIVYTPLFAHLDDAPIQVWDEMRNAQSALEMNQTGQKILVTFDGRPETWNTKPPLLIWILALSQSLLGYNELAVRLPSALAGLATCFLIAAYLRRQLGTWLPGIFSVLVLITTIAYVDAHGTRTGDYDAMLTFFTTAAVCSTGMFAETEKGRWLYAASIAIILAALTKGIAGLFICPSILIYLIIQKKLVPALKSKETYIGVAAFLLIVGGYYMLRESVQPGYWNLVMQNELFGRFNDVVESHKGPFFTYYDDLKNWAFVPWVFFVVPSILAGVFSKDVRQRNVVLLAGLAGLSLFLIISSAETKLSWYLIPTYPFFAITCGVLVYQFYLLLGQIKITQQFWSVNVLQIFLLIAVFWAPYEKILNQSTNGLRAKPDQYLVDASSYFKNVIHGQQNLDGNVLCGDAYPIFWYKNVINHLGHSLKEVPQEELQPGQKVYVWEEQVMKYVRKRYEVEEIGSLGYLRLLSVHAIKKEQPASDTTLGKF